MFRICPVLLFVVALSLCVNAAAPSADQIFPDSTKGFVSIRNLGEFTEQWKKTQFGQLVNDPLMEDFKKEVQKILSERFEQAFGLTLDVISSFPSGEVALGMIALPDQLPGHVLMADVAGKRTEINEYLDNLTKKLVDAGIHKTIEDYQAQQITVLTFPSAKMLLTESVERRIFYMFWQDLLIISDRLHLLQTMTDRLAGQKGTSPLAEVETYQVVMKRCLGDMPDGTPPIIRWYIEPLDYGESVQTMLQGQGSAPALNRRDRPSIVAALKQQGLDAVRGIGGIVSVKTEAPETVYRTFIHAQKPYRLAMQMFHFPDNINFVPPTWMPGDLARCTMFYIDPLAVFDNMGGLFDAVVMPGEEGVLRDILEGLENDPHGPKISIREELVVNLGNRILGMSRYDKPTTVNSESIVVAVELKAGKESAMLAGIEKLFGTDPEMQATEHKTYKIWHRRPAPDVIEPEFLVPEIFGNKPSGNSTIIQVAAQVPQIQANAQQPPMFPEGGVVVAKGCLFVSTNIEYLKVVLDRLDTEAGASIRDEAEYKAVDKIFANMGLTDKPHFFQFFARTHETLRPTYEMIRLDRMAQSQALFAKLLNEVLSPKDEEGAGLRRQIIDGSKLPEFEKVEHYFGSVGIYGASEENGYFIKGFSLERK